MLPFRDPQVTERDERNYDKEAISASEISFYSEELEASLNSDAAAHVGGACTRLVAKAHELLFHFLDATMS